MTSPDDKDEQSGVPDALDPLAGDGESPHEHIFVDPALWGGEAGVRDTPNSGSLRSTDYPDFKTITSEIRELERRVRARLTPVFPLETRRVAPLRAAWRRYRDWAMRDRSAVVDEMGRDPIYASRWAATLGLLYRRYFRAQAEGIDNLPATGRVILVANHSGALPYDALMLMQAVALEHPARRLVRPLLEDDVFHFPYLGTFLNRLGAVRACPENAERLLADGQPVAVFPEGSQGIGKLFKDRYQLQRFGRGGFVKLAMRTGSPIVPVAIVGAEEAAPLLARMTWLGRVVGLPHLPVTPVVPLPSKWTLRFGAPLDLAGEHGAQAASDRLLVARLADHVRLQIQDMIDEIVGSRKSAVFG
jgi:1-acyl-sn-glycerol-3-phosphate acyltransferase